MASNVVYARSNAVLAHGGQRIAVRAWEPWDAADPLVAAYPDHFAASLEAVRTTQDPSGLTQVEQPVEQATRAPGERRATRRPRPKAGA